jgi:hypothetical protein
MNIFSDYETFKATMSKEEILAWFQKRLNRSPEAYDVYQVAKEFYQLGSFSRALVCLQQYVGSINVGCDAWINNSRKAFVGILFFELGRTRTGTQGVQEMHQRLFCLIKRDTMTIGNLWLNLPSKLKPRDATNYQWKW